MWTKITDGEIYEVVSKQPPEEACKPLVNLAERRGADDNLTIQVVQVQAIERLSYYRGLPTYQKESPAVMGSELEVGQTLDGRFRITDLDQPIAAWPPSSRPSTKPPTASSR